MVIDCFKPHFFLKGIECMGGGAFKPCVGGTRRTDAVNNLFPAAEFLHHLHNRHRVILQVGINGDCRVTTSVHRHQPRQKHILMASVMCQGYAFDTFVGQMQPLNHIPCAVFAAVIAQKHITFSRRNPVSDHTVDNIKHFRNRKRQSLLFIITRHHNGDYRCSSHGDIHDRKLRRESMTYLSPTQCYK